MSDRNAARLAEILQSNWQAEMEGACSYASLADRETDPQRQSILNSLAAGEREHAALWKDRIESLNLNVTLDATIPKENSTVFVARSGSPASALRRLELDESRDIARYGKQLRELDDPETTAILARVIADEKTHYQSLSALIRSNHPASQLTPEEAQSALNDLIAERAAGQRKAGTWVGDAVYGVNDGLGSIFGIVSGVSGATTGNSHFVLIAGLAGMIASALSMGSGAYLAAKSEREIYAAEYAREADAAALNEPEALEILTLSYQVRGLNREDAERFVEHIAKDKQRLVAALAKERLNTTEESLAAPWVSALSGSLSTAIGAFIPIVPFFFTSGYRAIILAAIVSLVAHFIVGAGKSLITIRSWWSSGFEMTFVGALEGVVTYVIGIGLGKLGG